MNTTKQYSIAYKGLKNGEHTFEFEVGDELFQLFGNTEIKGGHCLAKVHLTRSDRQLQLQVDIQGHVVVECDRCLGDFELPIDEQAELLVKFSDEVREYDGETLWLSPAEDFVDLAQFIYESIVLALPYQRVHPEGECDPDMLRRFRIVSDKEFETIEAAAGKSEGNPEWNRQLEALKEELEELEKQEE